jgi:hypothetical protein
MNQRNGHPGYGFELRGPKGNRTKVADLHEQQVMRWIVEQRQAGWTWERIYFGLLRRRARTRAGREWSVTGLRDGAGRQDARAYPQTTQKAPPETKPGG